MLAGSSSQICSVAIIKLPSLAVSKAINVIHKSKCWAARCALDEAELQEIWLVEFLDGGFFFRERGRQGRKANGATGKFFGNDFQESPVGRRKPLLIYAQKLQGKFHSFLI